MLTKIKRQIFNIGGGILIKSPALYRIVKRRISRLHIYRTQSLYSYIKNNNLKLKMISDATERDYLIMPKSEENYESGVYKEVVRRPCSRQYVCVLEKAIVRGDTDGVILGDSFLTDKIEFDKKGFSQHPPVGAKIGEDSVLILNSANMENRKIDKAISLIKMWSYNYFHFVFEGMSKLGSVEDIEEYRNWPIIIDECVKRDPRNLEIIELLNVNNRDIIWIKQGECIEVNELVIPACMAWATWDVKEAVKNSWGYMISELAGSYLRETISSRYTPQRQYGCVYVARGNNKRLINEPEVIEYFKDVGFEIFYPDKVRTFREEIDCFATAKCIVSCAGGASTNLVFCEKNAEIYCILPYKFRCDNCQDVTSTVGINSKLRDAQIVQDGGLLMYSRMLFPLEKCEKIVEEMKEKGYLSSRNSLT